MPESIRQVSCMLSQAEALRVCVAVEIAINRRLSGLDGGASEAIDCFNIEAILPGGDCHVAIVCFHGFTVS